MTASFNEWDLASRLEDALGEVNRLGLANGKLVAGLSAALDELWEHRVTQIHIEHPEVAVARIASDTLTVPQWLDGDRRALI